MPINLSPLPGRNGVAWLNNMPASEGERVFMEREYAVMPCTDDDLENPEFLAVRSAVVFTQDPQKPLQIARDLGRHARRLLNYDCRIILLPELTVSHILINKIDQLKLPTWRLPKKFSWQNTEDGPLPCAGYFEEKLIDGEKVFSWSTVANFISNNPPGPAPNRSLEITPNDAVNNLDPEAKLLIQRAFWDCKSVHLVAMDEGRSGAQVYRAHAERNSGFLLPWPLPYFVKIDKCQKIFDEFKVYVEKVDPYIPFHLGPQLVRDRCCLGARKGIIVGDYVEESEKLLDCACQGRAATAIACLFDRTLLGWHRCIRKEENTSLSEGLLRYFPRSHKFPQNRLDKAKQLGAKHDLEELRELFKSCTSTPVLVASIHGDLHAKNVLVRTNDAIVIDFYRHEDNFPLVYEAACLEASLLVEGFRDLDPKDVQEWLRSLEPLYNNNDLTDGKSQHINPKDRFCWFHACVRQIRRYAQQWEYEKGQYAVALALALLHKASKDKNAPEPEKSCRAAAYVLAERILDNAFGSRQAAKTKAEKEAS
jgi:hypothetical protein